MKLKVAREGLVPSLLLVAVGAGLALAVHPLAAAPCAVLLLFTLWFFRDPPRRPPSDPCALISPADGKIIRATPAGVSIFMNVFDVHVCRAPSSGVVERAEHIRGRFLAAFREDAPRCNERLVFRLSREGPPIQFTLIAGLIARRIVSYVSPGDRLEAGQRLGMIRFGSRVDVELPDGASLAVGLNDRVVAGETVLARLGSPPRETGGGPGDAGPGFSI